MDDRKYGRRGKGRPSVRWLCYSIDMMVLRTTG